MTFLEELRAEAVKACKDKRHRELSAKRMCRPESLDDLRDIMLKEAKEGNWSALSPIEGLAAPEWRPIYSKDYRSHEKARFDRELCEFLSLHFEGVQADSRDRWTIRLSWR